MKLYYSKGACSLSPRIIINEIGTKCTYEAVDLKTKKTESGKDFLTINAKGSVPVIETDSGEILTEGAVILQFLADKNNATKLLPALGNIQRYRVLEWVNYVATELHKSCGPLFSPAVPQEMKDKFFVPNLKTKLTYVDKQLTKTFLLGDTFTLPDAYLCVILNWLPIFKIDINEWTHLAKYFANLKQYPSVAKSLKEEGLVAVSA